MHASSYEYLNSYRTRICLSWRQHCSLDDDGTCNNCDGPHAMFVKHIMDIPNFVYCFLKSVLRFVKFLGPIVWNICEFDVEKKNKENRTLSSLRKFKVCCVLFNALASYFSHTYLLALSDYKTFHDDLINNNYSVKAK